jgi:hypothetical protein
VKVQFVFRYLRSTEQTLQHLFWALFWIIYCFWKPAIGHQAYVKISTGGTNECVVCCVSLTYCNKFAGLYFTMEVYYTQKLNTQLLITVHNSSRNLTHAWQILEPHCLEPFKLSRTTTNCNYCTTASFLFRSQNTTVLVHLKTLSCISHCRNHSNVSVQCCVTLEMSQAHCYATVTITLL